MEEKKEETRDTCSEDSIETEMSPRIVRSSSSNSLNRGSRFFSTLKAPVKYIEDRAWRAPFERVLSAYIALSEAALREEVLSITMNEGMDQHVHRYGFVTEEKRARGNGLFAVVQSFMEESLPTQESTKLTVKRVLLQLEKLLKENAQSCRKVREYLQDEILGITALPWWLESQVLAAFSQVANLQIAVIKLDGGRAEVFTEVAERKGFLTLGYGVGRYIRLRRDRNQFPQPELSLPKRMTEEPVSVFKLK